MKHMSFTEWLDVVHPDWNIDNDNCCEVENYCPECDTFENQEKIMTCDYYCDGCGNTGTMYGYKLKKEYDAQLQKDSAGNVRNIGTKGLPLFK